MAGERKFENGWKYWFVELAILQFVAKIMKNVSASFRIIMLFTCKVIEFNLTELEAANALNGKWARRKIFKK